ncbi:TPA: hypothetical protein DEB72_00820 [Patescibacteria group bacterium]|nr:hypothetical protein [Patescibacteria group bacterium]
MKIIYKTLSLILSALWFWPAAVLAQDEFGLYDAAWKALPTGVPTPVAIIATVIQIILSVIGVVALILILYAGWQWLTAAGNEEKINQAKKVIAGSVVGLALIFSSYIIANFIFTNVAKSVGSVSSACNQAGQTCAYDSQCCTDQSLVCDRVNKTCQPPRTICANDGLACLTSCTPDKNLGPLDCIAPLVCCLP